MLISYHVPFGNYLEYRHGVLLSPTTYRARHCLRQIPENSINQNTNINNANNKNSKIKDSLNSSMTFVKEISRINSTNNMNITHGELSTSQMYILPPSTLSEAELFKT